MTVKWYVEILRNRHNLPFIRNASIGISNKYISFVLRGGIHTESFIENGSTAIFDK